MGPVAQSHHVEVACFMLQGVRQLLVAPCILRTTMRHYFRVQGAFRFLPAVFCPGSKESNELGSSWRCSWRRLRQQDHGGGKLRSERQRCHIPVGLQAIPNPDTPLLPVSCPGASLDTQFFPWPTSWSSQMPKVPLSVVLQVFPLTQVDHCISILPASVPLDICLLYV